MNMIFSAYGLRKGEVIVSSPCLRPQRLSWQHKLLFFFKFPFNPKNKFAVSKGILLSWQEGIVIAKGLTTILSDILLFFGLMHDEQHNVLNFIILSAAI